MVLRSVGPSHQFLAKPCDPEVLTQTIARACSLRDTLDRSPLRKLVSGMSEVPSMPSLYKELIGLLQSGTASLKEVGSVVAQDAGMTAQLLRLVNSAYFGITSAVTSAERAVCLLGLGTITSLVLSSGVFKTLESRVFEELNFAWIWDHCLATGVLSSHLARLLGAETRVIEDAFTAGLLHDIGRVILCANMGEEYEVAVRGASERRKTTLAAEEAAFGANHAEVGAYVMRLWGLPDSVSEAIAYHHRPSRLPGPPSPLLTAVHVADCVEHEIAGRETALEHSGFDKEYLLRSYTAEEVRAWREFCEEKLAAEEVC